MAEEEYPNYRRISDQAFLLANIDILTKKEKDFIKDRENIVKLTTSPETSINSIYNFKDFIISNSKLNSADLSFLIPFIKIFKIYPDKGSALIPFNNFYPKNSIDAITSNLSDRGYQANLVSVEFVSQGKDYATTFLHGVKLKIIFDSIATIFNEKSLYLNLFNPPKKTGNIQSDYYQIMLQFGWNTEVLETKNINSKELQKFASLSSSNIFLNYIMHKININEDGSALLEIEYNGAFESMARNANEINILSNKTMEEMKNLEEEVSSLEQEITNNGDRIETEKDQELIKAVKVFSKDNTEVTGRYKDKVAQLKIKYDERSNKNSTTYKNFKETLIENISKQYGTRMPALSINKAIYEKGSKIIEGSEKIESGKPVEEVDRILKQKNNDKPLEHNEPEINFNYSDVDFFENLTTENITIAIGQAIKNIKIPKYNIPYFSFGALLSAIESLKENNFIIAAGNCFISQFANDSHVDEQKLRTDPKYKLLVDNKLKLNNEYYVLDKTINEYNILDIPIALSTFKQWFLNNIVSQNLTSMTLNRFLELCINDLLILAIKPDNQDYVPKQNVKFKYLLDKISSSKDKKSIISNLKDGQLNFADLSEKQSDKTITTEAYNILVFYTFPNYMNRKSNFKEDIQNGIPHFFYGNYKGTIKKMTFREETIPHYKEANIQSQVDKTPTWRPGVFLRGKYNVLIEMYGTVNYRIGTLIYISPTFTGVTDPETVIKYGIGGYFLITSIKHSIESGKFDTIIEANWVATGDGTLEDINGADYQVFKKPTPIEQKQENTKRIETTKNAGAK